MVTAKHPLHTTWPTYSVEGFPQSRNLIDRCGKHKSASYEASSSVLYQEAWAQRVNLVSGSLFILLLNLPWARHLLNGGNIMTRNSPMVRCGLCSHGFYRQHCWDLNRWNSREVILSCAVTPVCQPAPKGTYVKFWERREQWQSN